MLNHCKIIISIKTIHLTDYKPLLSGTLFGFNNLVVTTIFRIRKDLNFSKSIYRPHIAVVGQRDVGKSRFVNTLIGMEVSAVSEIAGTTTNPVKNHFELLPYGPVLIVDTSCIDDKGELGNGKITQTIKTISTADLVVLIVDSRSTISSKERELLAYLDKIEVPFIIVVNKIEFGINENLLDELKELRATHYEVSCKEKVGFDELRRKIIRMLPRQEYACSLKNLISAAEKVLIILPSDIDSEQQKLLISQIEIIKSTFNKKTSLITCADDELSEKLKEFKIPPDFIITESYLVNTVAGLVSDKVKITTFGVLINRLKAKLPVFIKGLKSISNLEQGDKILIAEGCNEHPQNNCKFKIKEWLCSNSKKELNVDFIINQDFHENLSEYKLIVHCDGCKLNNKQMQTRVNESILMDVPIVTYGIFSSFIQGAIPRVVAAVGIKNIKC